MRRQLALLVAILALYAVVLGRTVTFDFVWDDVHEIANNPAFERPLAEGLLATQTERTDPTLTELPTIQLAYDSFRPLVFASLWVDCQLWGRAPAPLHATNLVLGAIAILLAYVLARRWLGGTAALVPTAVFALHPIQIEAVAYISGRADLLAGLFALLACHAGLRASDEQPRPRVIGWLAVAALAFACSLLAKEAYIGLPVVVAAALVAGGSLRARWWIPVALAGVAAAYLGVRAALVTATSGQALGAAILDLPGVWLEYLRIVVLPFDLSTERLRHPAFVVPGLVITVLLVVAAVVAHRRGGVPRELRVAAFGLVWMAVLVAPASVAVRGNGVVADRYFYAPLFGLALALTALARQAIAHRRSLARPLAAAGALAALLWLAVAWRQVPVWRDNATLYAHAVEMTPESSMAQYRVGYLLAQAGAWPDAIDRFEAAVARDPDNVLALNNLGVGLLRTGQPARAETPLAHAVEVNPAYFRAWLNLGLARWEAGDRARGCEAIERALAINPGYAAAAVERQRRCASSPRAP